MKARLVDDRISSLVTEANLRISEQVTRISANYLSLLLRGGEFSLLGQTFNVLGLKNTQRILEALRPELPAGSPFAERARPGDPVLAARAPEPEPRQSTPGHDRPPDRGRKGGRLGLPAQPRLVRDRGRDDGHPDVRHRAAGRRLAGARARGERLPPADPGAGGADGAPGREGGSGRGAVDRGHALDAGRPVAVRRHRLGPLPAVRSGDRGGRHRLRRLRGGDRGSRPRGPRQLAARLHDLAADRVRLPGRVRHGQPRPVRRDQGDPGAVPLRPGARRDLGRPRRGRTRRLACRSSTWRSSPPPTGCWRGWRCAASLR